VNPRRSILACLAGAILVLGLQQTGRAPRVAPVDAPAVARRGANSSPVAIVSAAEPARPASWSRPEAVRYLTQYFSREQLRRELDLEQARYRGQYWQAEPGLAELQAIESRRTEAIRRMTIEMNALLADMCPGETGEPLTLVPFFSLDRPAPNLAFLSEASREKMERALLAREVAVEADPMLAAATLLSGRELADYTRWNAPPSAALRNRLAGFEASETEFNDILEWQAATGSAHEVAAREELIGRLGPDRFAQLDRLLEPAVHTAAQDLHRLGLSIDQADWLADFRQAAAAQLQRSWSDPRLSAARKQEKVDVLRGAFRAELAAELRLPPEATDLLP
jgi:hypothetical protein